jgi:hypothetical protein
MNSLLTKHQNFLFYILLISVSLFALSCDDDSAGFVFEEGRCQFSSADIDGIAEINGINRFLTRGDVSTGEGLDTEILFFQVGGFRPDCSLHEQIDVHLLLNRDSTSNIDGTYPIVRGGFNSGGQQEIGTAVGDIITEIEDSFDRQTTEFVNGAVIIREVGFFRFEIELVANDNGTNTPITLQFANPPF